MLHVHSCLKGGNGGDWLAPTRSFGSFSLLAQVAPLLSRPPFSQCFIRLDPLPLALNCSGLPYRPAAGGWRPTAPLLKRRVADWGKKGAGLRGRGGRRKGETR